MKDSFYKTPVIIVAVGLIGLALLIMSGSAKKANNGSADVASATPVPYAAHMKGAADAKVTITEYGDFQCPACKAYASAVKAIAEKYGAQVKVEFRHFPLPMHPNAPMAARAAESAGAQGKFWEMHDELYEHQDEWANTSDPKAKFAEYATEIGLDAAKFATDLDNPELLGHIASDKKEGEAVGVNYTPYFLLNGQKITNPQNETEFNALVENALQNAGTPYVSNPVGPAPSTAQ